MTSRWLDYDTYRGTSAHTVTGHVVARPRVFSPQLGNHRDILVYLPPSYSRSRKRRYPVLYMHDGQNLFDETTSFVGEWHVDETMERLAGERGLEIIVVGIPNTGEARMAEYSPFPDPNFGGGQGEAYLDFLVDTVKPMVDKSFRTRPDRAHTGIAGSSMGGLISFYAFFARASVFGKAAAFSPSLMFGWRSLFAFVRFSPFVPGKIYLDMGACEFEGRAGKSPLLRPWYRRQTLWAPRRMRDLLVRKGYRLGRDLRYVEDPDGRHNEAAWAARFPGAVTFLFGQSSS